MQNNTYELVIQPLQLSRANVIKGRGLLDTLAKRCRRIPQAKPLRWDFSSEGDARKFVRIHADREAKQRGWTQFVIRLYKDNDLLDEWRS